MCAQWSPCTDEGAYICGAQCQKIYMFKHQMEVLRYFVGYVYYILDHTHAHTSTHTDLCACHHKAATDLQIQQSINQFFDCLLVSFFFFSRLFLSSSSQPSLCFLSILTDVYCLLSQPVEHRSYLVYLSAPTVISEL